MSSILKTYCPDCCITIIDLGPVSLFQAINLQYLFPNSSHYTIKNKSELAASLKRSADFTFCPTDVLSGFSNLYKGYFDLAINSFSMGEMEYSTINSYFKLLRSVLHDDGVFYCCNREKKKLPNGEVIRFDNYPFLPDDRFELDEYPDFLDFFWTLDRSSWRYPFISGYRGYPNRIRHVIVHF